MQNGFQVSNQGNQDFTIIEYLEWVFEENKNTYTNINNDQLQKTNLITTAINDEQIQDITWLFRKCLNEKEMKKQESIFQDLQHIIRHIFLFLLLLVQQQYDKKKLAQLMNSIGIIYKEQMKQIYIVDCNVNILYKKYPLAQITQQRNSLTKHHRTILNIWSELKDEKLDGVTLPEFDIEFLQDFSRLNVCLNMNQILKIGEEKKVKEKEKHKQKQIQQEQQAKRLFESSLRKEKIHQVKISKINFKQSQSLLLQPNGNIVKGKVWHQQNVPYLCPLWLNYKFQVVSFCNFNNLNSELRNLIGFISYQGPVNDYFEPHTNDFDNQNYGHMKTISGDVECKGGFKNGLFDGKNQLLQYSSLIYYGGYKNGQKHGEGYIREFYENKPIIMKGQFESNLKQGVFVNCQVLDETKQEIQFQIIGNIREQYKNDIRYDKIPADLLSYKASQNPCCNLLNFNEYGISNFQLASLRPGGWINSSVIDILVKQLTTLVKYLNLNQQIMGISKLKTYFINCSLFQDIFGSIITKDEHINHDLFNNQLQNQNLNIEQSFINKLKQPDYYGDKNIRIVFYFNLDRSHFLSALYENQKLYLIDSLKDQRQALIFQITKFLKYYGWKVENVYDDRKVSQQQNSYDCGAYTIYFISQIIKNQHLTIEQMFEKNCFEITQLEINYLRYLIYQNLVNNGASILELGR